MVSPSSRPAPLPLPADADASADRRFPFTGGGGRVVHPDDPEQKYFIAYCYHGWPAQHRRATFENVDEEIWGCRGYIWGGLDPGDGHHCGYKETGDVHPRYGVTTLQRVNTAWDGTEWVLPVPSIPFFKARQISTRKAQFQATRTPPASPPKRSADASQPLAGPSSPKKSKVG